MLLRRTDDGSSRSRRSVSGVYPDGWSGRGVTYTRLRCRGGSRHGSRRERRQAVRPSADGQRGRAQRHVQPEGRRTPDRSAAPARRRLSRDLHGHSDGGAGPREQDGRRTCARRALHRVRLPGSVRIAYDVTPLSHPRTGVGNYILGALKGMLEAPGEHELVAFGPVSIRGRHLLDEALAGLDVETTPRHRSLRARDATRVGGARPTAGRDMSSARSTSCTSATGCVRRSVQGVRATMIHDLGPLRYPGAPAPAHRAHAHGHRARGRQRGPRLRQLGVHRRRRCRTSRRSPRERIRVAYPGRRARRSRPRGRVTTTGRRTSSPPPRPTGARTSRRCVRQRRLIRSSHSADLGYVDPTRLAEPLPRRGGVRLPVALRGVRHARRRGDGERRPVRRLVAPVAGRGGRRRGGARRSRRVRRRSPPASARRSSVASELVPRGLAHARRFTWLETGRVHLQSYADAL